MSVGGSVLWDLRLVEELDLIRRTDILRQRRNTITVDETKFAPLYQRGAVQVSYRHNTSDYRNSQIMIGSCSARLGFCWVPSTMYLRERSSRPECHLESWIGTHGLELCSSNSMDFLISPS